MKSGYKPSVAIFDLMEVKGIFLDGLTDLWADIVGGLHDFSEGRFDYNGRVGMMAFEYNWASM